MPSVIIIIIIILIIVVVVFFVSLRSFFLGIIIIIIIIIESKHFEMCDYIKHILTDICDLLLPIISSWRGGELNVRKSLPWQYILLLLLVTLLYKTA